MFNLLKLPTDFDAQELEGAAEYAFDICFKGWQTEDFEKLSVLIKSKIGIDKYLEQEESTYRPYWLSVYALPEKERKKIKSELKDHRSLVLVYAYWRLVTGSLVVQNRLLELETLRTSSAQKVADTSLSFLSNLNQLLDDVPVWCDKMPVPSPFLDENGKEIHHIYDLPEYSFVTP
ncbi:hypothetical protein PTQ27_07720 [Mannheimia sp. AT1]|uniref:Uncharacterized protein n=1 Tax=Mannheimia cairinae TaxID=3025936 RepID=A0ABT5MU08_9PAST|nr:hypothetical protein [Mannheimia cairinae]MDD0824348.1 hypothetical protein [Mannheimia cairinae]MDD0826529.1 hypothetical protein [Mannheimia cairinae]